MVCIEDSKFIASDTDLVKMSCNAIVTILDTIDNVGVPC